MAQLSMKSLIDSGAHYGHLARKWNPKMKPFIFGTRNQVHIINLQYTIDNARKAGTFVYNLGKEGKTLLCVGTKAQAQEIVEQEASRAGAFFVTERWLGGTLTNFAAIRNITEKYQSLKALLESEEGTKIIKKERVMMEKDMARSLKYVRGILAMDKLPDALCIVDTIREEIAVKEAKCSGIPTIAVVDSNTDPDPITYPIPGNDDALKSIQLFTHFLCESYREGRQIYQENEALRAKEKAAQQEKHAATPATKDPKSKTKTPAPAPKKLKTDTEPTNGE